jgi:hypothetical protein
MVYGSFEGCMNQVIPLIPLEIKDNPHYPHYLIKGFMNPSAGPRNVPATPAQAALRSCQRMCLGQSIGFSRIIGYIGSPSKDRNDHKWGVKDGRLAEAWKT